MKLLRTTENRIQSYYEKTESLKCSFYEEEKDSLDDDGFKFPGAIKEENKLGNLEFFSQKNNIFFFEQTSNLVLNATNLSAPTGPKNISTTTTTTNTNIEEKNEIDEIPKIIGKQGSSNSQLSLGNLDDNDDEDDHILLQLIERKISFDIFIALLAE